ncbi:MAG: hypothetical protein KDC95_12645 [Planctomycetes bacterium]|nr:hypothetical protein [Planctomycetota bacterium]
MKYTIGISVLVLLLGGFAWIVFVGERAPGVEFGPAPDSWVDAASASAVGQRDALAANEPDASRRVDPATAPDEPRVGTDDSAIAQLSGRCVDENGNPLAGCVVRLHGWGINQERLDAYMRDHDEVAWEDPLDVTTGADGCFVVEFVPPPPFQFMLSVESTDHVPMQGHWSEIAAGMRKDLGDLRFLRGSRVVGRVVSETGVAVANVDVAFDWQDPRGRDAVFAQRPDVLPRTSHNLRANADGTFAISGRMQEGRWAVVVRDRELIEPKTIELSSARDGESIQIVVAAEDDSQIIRGIVVDDLGSPIARARVETLPRLRSTSWLNETGRDGAFVIKRRAEDSANAITIRLRADGHEEARSETPIDWGTHDVRIVLHRGLDVEVCVRSTNGVPIAEYGLRLFPEPGSPKSRSSRQSKVRNRGVHAGGVTTVTGVLRGTNVLIVEPKGTRWQRSAMRRFEVTDSGAPRQYVELMENVSRVVRVIDAGGTPVAGSQCVLVEALSDTPLDDSTNIVEVESLQFDRRPNRALRVDDAKTNERGEATLTGPEQVALALLVRGSHVPVCRQDVRLDVGQGPIEVTVSAGARIVGKIGPAELITQLRIQAGLPATGELGEREARRAPGVLLVRRDGASRQEFPRDGTQRIADDGSFAIDAVPPGNWNLALVSSRGSGFGGTTSRVEVAALRNLEDGATRRVDLDLSGHLRGTLSALVLLDGEAFGEGRVICEGSGHDRANGRHNITRSLRTDAAGRIEQLVAPATYTIHLEVADAKTKSRLRFRAPKQIVVAPGAKVQATISVQTVTLRIVVRDSKGEKATHVRLVAKNAADDGETLLPDQDDDGVIRARLTIGTWRLQVLHADLYDPQKAPKLERQFETDPGAWARAHHDVARIQLTHSRTDEIPVVLPASAGF